MTDTALSSDQPQAIPVNDGEMAHRSRSFNWEATPIAPSSEWSPALRSTMELMLTNRFLLLWWEPQYLSLYNDAYAPLLGSHHLQALGLPVCECWRETWHRLQSSIDGPFHGGTPTWIEYRMIEVNRATGG